jgi:two-component system, NarL family, response regulator NreC
MIKVLIADDHGVVRKGVRFLLQQERDIEIAGEAEDGREAVKLAKASGAHVLIMDIAMPQLNGIDAASQVAKVSPSTNVLILSMYSDEEYLIRALNAGAKGYLLKDQAETDLVRAVRLVAAGRTFFSPQIEAVLMEDYVRRLQRDSAQDSYGLLTDREREVLQLLAEGKSNKEAAHLLELSLHTVETHRTNLMQKLGLHNTAEIVLYAVRKRIIS